jgi:Uma2 family endonuclease
MDIMERSERSGPPIPIPIDWRDGGGRDQVVVLHGISWEQYDAIHRAKGEAPRPIIAYLDGELEIVTTSTHHEFVKTMLARLVEAYAEQMRLRLNGYGMATLRKKARRAGAEPDEWYVTQKGGKTPDLAIEVVFTSGGVDKLEIYRRLKVPEVWFWVDGRIWIYRLVDATYEQRAASTELPGIDLGVIERIIATADEDEQTEAVRAYRRTLKPRG